MSGLQGSEGKPKRPISITVFCVLGFIGAPCSIFLVFSPLSQQIGSWYPPYLAVSALVGLACAIGLWMMKRWAVYTYTGFVVFNQVVLLLMHVWSPLALIIPGIFVFFMLKNRLRMS